MKKFILGFIIGALLLGIFPVNAAIREYVLKESDCKLVIDGQTYGSDLPILNYDGYNYVPAASFRDICDKIGVEFKWVNETKEIQINTSFVSEGDNIMSETLTDNNVKIFQRDGYIIVLYDDVEYVTIASIDAKHSQSYRFYIEDNALNLYQHKNGDPDTKKLILGNIGHTTINNMMVMEYAYFENIVLPLLK